MSFALARSIVEDIAHEAGVSPAAIAGTGRSKTLCRTRDAAIAAIRSRAGLTFSEIGELLKRDHSSIVVAERRHKARVAQLARESFNAAPGALPPASAGPKAPANEEPPTLAGALAPPTPPAPVRTLGEDVRFFASIPVPPDQVSRTGWAVSAILRSRGVDWGVCAAEGNPTFEDIFDAKLAFARGAEAALARRADASARKLAVALHRNISNLRTESGALSSVRSLDIVVGVCEHPPTSIDLTCDGAPDRHAVDIAEVVARTVLEHHESTESMGFRWGSRYDGGAVHCAAGRSERVDFGAWLAEAKERSRPKPAVRRRRRKAAPKIG